MLTEVSQIDFFWDLLLGFLNLAIGRLLPRLHVPKTDLTNKVAIITGGNSGIGFQIALEFARRGATVHLACRNASKADNAVSEITNQIPESHGRMETHPLDTSSLASVRAFAEEWKGEVDILMHNAGVASVPEGQSLFTPDGFPLLYATNFLGPFLLTYLLEKYLAPGARIISTTSTGQYAGDISARFSLNSVTNHIEPGFHTSRKLNKKVPADANVYNNTKLVQVAFTRLLQQHFDHENGLKNQRLVHCFTPGFTSTPMVDKSNIRSFRLDPIWWVLQSTVIFATDPRQGAATGFWLATTKDEGGNGGGYWDRMTRRVSKIDVTDPHIMQRLWVRWEADAGIEWR